MRNITVLVLFLFSSILIAQTNLVPNHNFNKLSKKAKEKGQIILAVPWISPTLTQADLYIKDKKNPELGTEGNIYGAETPMEGDNFAGFLAYSPKGKVPRSYLQVKLTQPLEEDSIYCITFYVSLADLSKFSCNYLGAFISNDAVSANNNDVLQLEPQIISRRLKVYEQQYSWTPVCAKFKASGGEQFLTIGNFAAEAKLKIGKVKRPQGFNSPQTNDAYYYIDNVIVTKLGETDKCDCDFIPGVDDMETINKNFKSDITGQSIKTRIIDSEGSIPTPSVKTLENNFVVFFEEKKADISLDATIKMDEFIASLKTNSTDTIILNGFIDISEKDEDKLDGKRIGVVYKYIVSKGVKKERIVKNMIGIAEDKDKTKNMKVEIKIQGH